jgi:hypothetical protein
VAAGVAGAAGDRVRRIGLLMPYGLCYSLHRTPLSDIGTSMDLSQSTKPAKPSDPHSRRLVVDSAEWRAYLERLAEIRARLDEDAVLSPNFMSGRYR